MIETVDPIALSALRPGMPTARLSEVLGALRGEHALDTGGKTAGWVAFLLGFEARLEVGGRIGQVRFGRHFPAEVPVDGVHIGATLAAVRVARPDLTFHETSTDDPERQLATVQSAEGICFEVRFVDQVVDLITIARAAATYPKIVLPAYPEPAGAPGAPFADPALKLAVLSALLRDGVIDLGKPEQLAAHVLDSESELDVFEENFEPRPEIRDWLERYPLDDALLGQVKSLSLDGGNEIYPFIDGGWGGEDDQFDVETLAGIEHLPNLETFDVTALIDRVDLRQLVGLPALRTIEIGVDVVHVEALLEMPALERVGQMSDAAYDEATGGGPTRAVYEALKARGVQIWVHWTTHVGPDEPPAYE
ncbi:DUF6892 domain-containing protein [Antarcticirhabdus aurantiaca]|uniref:Uncharacterized protein n=1 Tax=Antarcticirhabdus aurantiaca TaxID=2606717 RepID=A0ACD4NPH4_9HYPH|nr:hypothetical protein [Antarcticirhabdus aurantiaca]WAJ28607.1 hypothetical protein OXU80_28055 [Jeongeuplla avenae]